MDLHSVRCVADMVVNMVPDPAIDPIERDHDYMGNTWYG